MRVLVLHPLRLALVVKGRVCVLNQHCHRALSTCLGVHGHVLAAVKVLVGLTPSAWLFRGRNALASVGRRLLVVATVAPLVLVLLHKPFLLVALTLRPHKLHHWPLLKSKWETVQFAARQPKPLPPLVYLLLLPLLAVGQGALMTWRPLWKPNTPLLQPLQVRRAVVVLRVVAP